MSIDRNRLEDSFRAFLEKDYTSDWREFSHTRIISDDTLSIHGLKLKEKRRIAVPAEMRKLLTEEELGERARFSTEWRQQQYDVTRLLLKRCCADLLAFSSEREEVRKISILNDLDGAPRISIERNHPLFGSIAHSTNLLLAISSKTPVGIDVESIGRSHRGLEHDSLQHSYSDVGIISIIDRTLPTADEETRKLALWCARESVFKALSHSGVESPLRVVLFEKDGYLFGGKSLRQSDARTIFLLHFPDYLISIAA